MQSFNHLYTDQYFLEPPFSLEENNQSLSWTKNLIMEDKINKKQLEKEQVKSCSSRDISLMHARIFLQDYITSHVS